MMHGYGLQAVCNTKWMDSAETFTMDKSVLDRNLNSRLTLGNCHMSWKITNCYEFDIPLKERKMVEIFRESNLVLWMESASEPLPPYVTTKRAVLFGPKKKTKLRRRYVRENHQSKNVTIQLVRSFCILHDDYSRHSVETSKLSAFFQLPLSWNR